MEIENDRFAVYQLEGRLIWLLGFDDADPERWEIQFVRSFVANPECDPTINGVLAWMFEDEPGCGVLLVKQCVLGDLIFLRIQLIDRLWV